MRTAYLPVYETSFGKIVRKKDVSETSRDCDLFVEYSVERELTEFGEAAPSILKNFMVTRF